MISKLHYESQLSDGKGGNKDSLTLALGSELALPVTSQWRDCISIIFHRVASNTFLKVPDSSVPDLKPDSVILLGWPPGQPALPVDSLRQHNGGAHHGFVHHLQSLSITERTLAAQWPERAES